MRLLRSHALTSSTWDRHRGHDPAYDVVDVGFNYRLDEPRAALGLSRLGRLDENIGARRAIVRAYRERLAEVPDGFELTFDEQAVERSSHFAFPVLLRDRSARDRLRDALKAQRHPDDLVSGAAHASPSTARSLHPDGLPRAARGGRAPLRAAAELHDGRGRRRGGSATLVAAALA